MLYINGSLHHLFVLALQCWVFFRHVHFMHFLTSQISAYAFSDISDKWGLHPRSLEVWLFTHTKGAFINYQQGALISCKVLVRIQWPPYRRGCRFYDPPKGCFPTCTMPPPPDDWWSVPKGPFKKFYDSQWDELSFLRTVERSLIMRISWYYTAETLFSNSYTFVILEHIVYAMTVFIRHNSDPFDSPQE